MWALRSLGVRQVLAPCAVGGLQVAYGPGTFLVPDQLVDRTSGRVQTFFDEGACHVSFADPYCSRLRGHLLSGLREQAPVDGGTMVVIEGPRFSTRAESVWYAEQGWAVVNMTGHPEAVLARELALCYATVALVTDHDAGVDQASSVSMDAVFEVFAAHTGELKTALADVIGQLGDERRLRLRVSPRRHGPATRLDGGRSGAPASCERARRRAPIMGTRRLAARCQGEGPDQLAGVVLTVILATPTSSASVTASVLNVSFSRLAATGLMNTFVPSRIAVSPSV
ncbi:hypothetical protein [Aeromicrobium sp. UC242_57]|uniref:phosphorylase family protein n=1 Tax=Aeromicrobium sp. UC242_57 TaxID=3374624 RepID=UPI003799DEED